MQRRAAPLRRRDFNITFWGDEVPVENFEKYKERLRYAVWQREIAPTTGRVHWQMYLEFHDPQYIDFVKKDLLEDNTAHVEIRRYSRDIAREYCMKKKTRSSQTGSGPWEWGTWAIQGKHTELDRVKRKLDDGEGMLDVAEEHFDVVARYPNGIQLYQSMLMQRKAVSEDRTIDLRIYFGASGTGKTFNAMKDARAMCNGDASQVFRLANGPTGVWWCGYESQPAVVIDDYYDWMQTTDILNWFDRYPVALPRKGKAPSWAAFTLAIFTSNFAPWEWKDKRGDKIPPRHVSAIMRRCTWIIEFLDEGGIRIHKRPDE